MAQGNLKLALANALDLLYMLLHIFPLEAAINKKNPKLSENLRRMSKD